MGASYINLPPEPPARRFTSESRITDEFTR